MGRERKKEREERREGKRKKELQAGLKKIKGLVEGEGNKRVEHRGSLGQ